MTKSRIAVILACVVAIALMGSGCGDSEADRKVQALNAARAWTATEPEEIIAPIVDLVTSGIPGASLFSGLIAEQVADQLAWRYSDPVKTSDQIYTVVATASAQATVDIPLVGEKSYGASLPFNLQVDIGIGMVTQWSPDLGGGAVGEMEPPS